MLYNNVERPISDVKSTQNIRLYADLLLFAPYLFYLGYKGKVTATDKVILGAIAGATIVYNAKNYIKNQTR